MSHMLTVKKGTFLCLYAPLCKNPEFAFRSVAISNKD